jgi:N-acetylmuramoyl-L-alanine amidase
MLPVTFLVLLTFLLSIADGVAAKKTDLPPDPPAKLAVDTPNPWFWLHAYDGTMTRAEFAAVLQKTFDPFGGLKSYIEWSDTEAKIYPSPTDHREPQFVLPFAVAPTPPHWLYRLPEEFRALTKPMDKPLLGLKIAIDPGHIGGKWGEIEERSTPYRDLGRIQEGDMNLITATILEKKLNDLGAEVLLTRHETEPVTPMRPENLLDEAREYYLSKRPELSQLSVADQIRSIGMDRLHLRANFLFVRKYEFMARAAKIRAFHPDLTVVLYINATPSSEWSRLIGVDQNIFFIHGSYTKEEAQDPTQQIRLVYKILDRVTPIEYEVATAIAQSFTQTTGIKPVPYMDSTTTRAIDPTNPYVVARNLGANRYYDGPVVTTEPYFMNNRTIARRLLAGDYDGLRVIDGKPVGSIFREYADCVIAGLLKAYTGSNPPNELVIPNSLPNPKPNT